MNDATRAELRRLASLVLSTSDRPWTDKDLTVETVESGILCRCDNELLAEYIAAADPRVVLELLEGSMPEKESRDGRQRDLMSWAMSVFGDMPGFETDSIDERLERFFEESVELAQALGMPEARALKVLSYVYARPKGDGPKEAGATAVTLAMLAETMGISLHDEEVREARRIMSKTKEHFQARHDAKLEQLGSSSTQPTD